MGKEEINFKLHYIVKYIADTPNGPTAEVAFHHSGTPNPGKIINNGLRKYGQIRAIEVICCTKCPTCRR